MFFKNLKPQTGLVLAFLLFLNKSPLQTQAVKNQQKNINQSEFSARSVGRSLATCFSDHETVKCLQKELINTLDAAAEDNSTWHYSDILTFEKREVLPNTTSISKLGGTRRSQRSFSDELAEKFLHVAETRSLRFQLPKLATTNTVISDAVDEIVATGSSSSPSDPLLLTTFNEEGRKKKDKDKNMAMMGGMVMMAMVAQMFLGKVILIAGAAFIMAKIALVVSVLGSLKKGTHGTSGSTTEHVIISGGGHGGGGGYGGSGGHSHSHESGWHRSMPHQIANFEPYNGEQESINAPPISIEERGGPPRPPLPPSSSRLFNNGKGFIAGKTFKPSSYYVVNDAQEMPAFL